MKRFLDSCRAERLKVFTTVTWWALGLVLVLYVAFTAAMIAGTIGLSITDPSEGFGDTPIAPTVYALAPTIGYIFPVLLGALSVTMEYRHQTLTPTLIWSGNRNRVLGAKVFVQFIMGMLYGIAGLIAAVLASVFFFMASGVDTGLSEPSIWLQFLRTVVGMGIWAVVGVGIGVLVRNQAMSIVIVIAFTQFVEPIARLAGVLNNTIANIVGFLPGAASDAFTGSSFYSAISSASGYEQLSWWAGGLVLFAYAAVALVLGWLTRWRADVA